MMFSRCNDNSSAVCHVVVVVVVQTHRVDVPFDQIVFLWLQHQIISSERDDARFPAAAGYLREAVRVEASAGQDVTAPHLVTLVKGHGANDENQRTTV